jgi:hypothetical protein
MKKIFNRDIGILNEATKDGNMAITDLKRKSAVKEVEKYAKMEIELEKVNIDWKTTPFSNKVKVDLDDLIKLEEQAKSYIANKPILDNALKMQENLEQSKSSYLHKIYNKLQHTEFLEEEAEKFCNEQKKLYNEQKNINSVLEQERNQNIQLQNRISEILRERQNSENFFQEELKKAENQQNGLKNRNKELIQKYNTLVQKYNLTNQERQKQLENNRQLQEKALNAEKSYKEKVQTLESHQESLNKELSLFKKALKLPENLKFDEIRKALEEKGLIEPERTYTRGRGMSR